MSIPPKVQLPSGRGVLLTKMFDPLRPWEISGSDGTFVLVRPRRGDSSRVEVYCADRVKPLLFDRADAEALQALLNNHRREVRVAAVAKALGGVD